MEFEICFIFISLKCILILANSTDPYKISYLPASDLGDKVYIVFQNTPSRGSMLQRPLFTFPFFDYLSLTIPNYLSKINMIKP